LAEMAAEKQVKEQIVVLAAGGTGGHLFPAQALAEELQRRGYEIHLLTDSRVRDYGSKFPATRVYDVPSATVTLRQPWRLPGRAWRLWRGYRVSKTILLQLKPRVVVGFGGYPSFPPAAAAARLNLPSIIHEQNAVMGRANRAVAARATIIASSFSSIANLSPRLRSKIELTGNPVRSEVLKFAGSAYDKPTAEKIFRILVFGGSQGARFFSEIIPLTARELAGPIRRKLKIIQQCRPEDIDQVKAKYQELGIEHDVKAFFTDLPKHMAEAHLVICRSGASTVAELAVIGRPAILVPLPHAVDNDQLRNAESFTSAGGGWLLPQAELTAEALAAVLTHLRYHEGELMNAAGAALEQGRPDAAARLADAVERLATAPKKMFVSGEVRLHHEATP
jgi:UDP-N-acetylglucosamine--N-acetylmuramyl-(pentapeptide) pyrophosphoryl-undecaprenol N-acetylglucosamine transferase